MTATQRSGQAFDPVAEIRSTRETAEKIAKDGATEGTDVARLLAGLIAHLADQMEKLAAASSSSSSSDGPEQGREDSGTQIADATLEEDVSPQDAPAAPARDPNAKAG